MPKIEFWYEFASTYSYPACMRIEKVAADAGVSIEWKPFLLGPLLYEQMEIKDSPFNIYPVKGKYMWRDLERICSHLKLPLQRPDTFPHNTVRASRIAMVMTTDPQFQAHAADFSKGVYLANFGENRDISDEIVLSEVLIKIGADRNTIIEQARTDETKEKLRAQTDEARQKGLFGSPSFVVGEELFWGNDRLEQAIAFAQSQP